MLVDNIGLANFLGKSGYDMLISIGYPVNDIQRLFNDGNTFKLVIFPINGDNIRLATWENISFLSEV